MIKVSIIVPVYKVPLEYLRTCFDSLIAQTMRDCEFIIISDGAPEGECSVCEEYVKKDYRFKFFNREHAGVSATRNFGINQAQGEFLTFVDADDWIEKETCEITYNYAKENDSEIVFWDYTSQRKIKTNHYGVDDIPLLEESEKRLCLENIIHPLDNCTSICCVACKLFLKDIAKRNMTKFDEELNIGEDRVFFFRIFEKSQRISYLRKSLYFYRDTPNSTMNSFQRNAFLESINYTKKLNALSKHMFTRDIANEIANNYFGYINKIYAANINYPQKLNEFNNLKKIFQKRSFRNLIQSADLPNFNTIARLELFFIKRNVWLLFSLRIAKFKFIYFITSFRNIIPIK